MHLDEITVRCLLESQIGHVLFAHDVKSEALPGLSLCLFVGTHPLESSACITMMLLRRVKLFAQSNDHPFPPDIETFVMSKGESTSPYEGFVLQGFPSGFLLRFGCSVTGWTGEAARVGSFA